MDFNRKSLAIGAGVVAIAWMIGVHHFWGDPPFIFLNALFGLEGREWLWVSVDLLFWLGIGVLLAILGLRSGNSMGQIFALIAVGVFVYFAWRLFHPPYVPSAA
jgi:hypothetical protein